MARPDRGSDRGIVCSRCDVRIDWQRAATVSYREPIGDDGAEGDIRVNARQTRYLCEDCRRRLHEFFGTGGDDPRYCE
ncbi:MAG: hypothetical protein ABEJ42_09570 [Halobacteriaceae archaeon]